MTKVTSLSDISGLPTYNENNDRITSAFENTVSRDGSGPNYMDASLDMNGHRILNLADAVSGQEPVTLSQAASIAGVENPLTQEIIGEYLYPQTDAEVTASVTPTYYYYPQGDARRYGLATDATGATNRAALDTAINVMSALGGGIIDIPSGTFAIDATVTVDVDRVLIQGKGPNATKFSFDPASTDVLFHFTKGTSSIVQAGIRAIGFTSSNSVTKTAIQMDDMRHCLIEDIGIAQGSWAGSGSIGVHTKGRDTLSMKRIAILCARPLLISQNPNHASLDTDHFHFEDMEIGSTETTGKVIEVETGVVLSNVSFGGYQAWTLGKYGFFYDDTTSPIDSYNVAFTGIRTEQASDATGYSFYIASTANDVKNLRWEQCYIDANRNGIYLRKAETVSIEDTFFAGTTGRTNFDITFQSRTELLLQNVFVNTGSTVTLTDAVACVEMPWNTSVVAMASTGYWRYVEAGSGSRKARREDGTLSFKYKGTLGDDASLALPARSSTGGDVAVFRVAMKYSTTLAYAHGAWIPGTAPDIYGTTDLVSNTSVDGDLCVVNDTGDVLTVINRLGGTADVVLDVVWSD